MHDHRPFVVRHPSIVVRRSSTAEESDDETAEHPLRSSIRGVHLRRVAVAIP